VFYEIVGIHQASRSANSALGHAFGLGRLSQRRFPWGFKITLSAVCSLLRVARASGQMKERMCFTADSSFARDDSGSAFALVLTMHPCTADEQTQGDMRSETMQLDEKKGKKRIPTLPKKTCGIALQ